MARDLTKEEIDVRIGTVSKEGKGMSLLLYKDARVDMDIMDETYGCQNWQRKHEFKDGKLYCSVGVRFVTEDGHSEWVWKEDVGTESNTEAEKGQASDSFKRACVNWGIGRELYNSPFVWVKGYDKFEKFKVDDIEITNKVVTKLRIIDSNGGVAFTYGYKQKSEPKTNEQKKVDKVVEKKETIEPKADIRPAKIIVPIDFKPTMTPAQASAIDFFGKPLGEVYKNEYQRLVASVSISSPELRDAIYTLQLAMDDYANRGKNEKK